MKLRIKTKLSLGLSFLFGVIILVGGLGAFYLQQLSTDAKAILTDNYESIDYVQKMMEALETKSIGDFEKNLKGQENNVTEIGEPEVTEKLRVLFERYKITPTDSALMGNMRKALSDITKVNMEAIVRKNEIAQHTADDALLYIALIGSLCFIVTFTFIVNFPGYIANPIRSLTDSIKEISNKNYDERLHFSSADEFGELAEAFNSMAQKLDHYEHSNLAKLLFEKKRIETIINKMSDPIIGLDENRNILFANHEAIRVLGIPESELIGKYASDVAVRNDLFRNLMRDVMNTPIASAEQKPLKIYMDGKESYFSKDILKVTNAPEGKHGTVIGYVIILKNITPFKELDLAKTNFIATISHEIKTPLASIQMCSQLLEDKRVGSLNEEQQKILNTVNEETNRLLKITGELLNLAQVETGTIQLHYQSVSPREIVSLAVNSLKFQAEQKKSKLEIHCPENLPRVHADLDKSAWVMVNLISNAIHYSPEESKIMINVASQGEYITFSVHDFGKGIDAKHLDRIFEKFYKVPNSDPSRTGTGLGLAISKDIISSEGGKIWVESEIGSGSTFYFQLKAED